MFDEQAYRDALAEIYTLTLRSEGKRERRTRVICAALLGERQCKLLKSADDYNRAIAAAKRAPLTQEQTDLKNSPLGITLGL